MGDQDDLRFSHKFERLGRWVQVQRGEVAFRPKTKTSNMEERWEKLGIPYLVLNAMLVGKRGSESTKFGRRQFTAWWRVEI